MAYLALLQPIKGRALPAVLAATHNRDLLARFVFALVKRAKRDIDQNRDRDPMAAAIAAIELRRYLDLAEVLDIEVGGEGDESP